MIRMPAEWEPQDSILMVFPHEKTDWSDDMQRAHSVFLRMASSISAGQKLILICDDVEKTKQFFCYHDRISFVKFETNDTWIRDFGPLCVYKDDKRILLDFRFNAWGDKYDASLDDLVTRHLHKNWHFMVSPLQSLAFVLEGGSIETDGHGTLLSTKQCLLNPNRNPDFSQAEIETYLSKTLGMSRILWLDVHALEGDDTDAHVDTLVRFIDAKTLAYVSCDDTEDVHFHPLQMLLAQLQEFTDYQGDAYTLIPLPLPSAKYKDSKRLAATYANFLICNQSVLLPTYDDVKDAAMIEVFKKLYPTREIIPINALRLIEEGGSIHCSTMHIPK